MDDRAGAWGRASQVWGHVLPHRRAQDRTEAVYDVFTGLFNEVCEHTGILNFGYAPGQDVATVDLKAAQAGMVHLVARGLPPKGRWLDVGCGVGGPACLQAQTHPEVQVLGINITHGHLSLARQRAAQEGLEDRVEFYWGDALDIPFPQGFFQGLYAIETAFHYPDKAQFAREAFRVLAPGGRLSVADIVLNPETATPLDRIARHVSGGLFAVPELFTEGLWRRALMDAGFFGVEIQDISAASLGLLGRWAERLDAHREALAPSYAPSAIKICEVGLKALHARGATSPLRYLLLEAYKP